MTVPSHDVRTAHVTQPAGELTNTISNIRLHLGINAHVQVNQDLTVLDRGVHALHLRLTRLRPDPTGDDTPPNEITLLLDDAARLHQLLGDALDRAHQLTTASRSRRDTDPTTTPSTSATSHASGADDGSASEQEGERR